MRGFPTTNAISDKLINASIYSEGTTELMGTADTELPAFEYMTEALTGLGIAGELETPVLGHFKNMTLKINWNNPTEQALGLLDPTMHHLEIWGSIQHLDAGTGDFVPKGIKVVARGMPKKVGIGKMEPGKKMASETELECSYVKISMDGKDLVEVDKLNFICRVMGEDKMAKVRSDLGKD